MLALFPFSFPGGPNSTQHYIIDSKERSRAKDKGRTRPPTGHNKGLNPAHDREERRGIEKTTTDKRNVNPLNPRRPDAPRLEDNATSQCGIAEVRHQTTNEGVLTAD